MWLTVFSLEVYAATYSIGVGPVGVGIGGPNPPSASNGVEYQSTIIMKKHEIVISIYPGVFYGWRSSIEGPYFSLGPGVVNNANGIGLGFSAAFGANLLCNIQCIMIEYRKAVGFNDTHILSPYAIRVGLTVKDIL